MLEIEIYCSLTKKRFNKEILINFPTIKCPYCKNFIKLSYGLIGLSDKEGIEIEDDFFHSIIYGEEDDERK